MQSHGNAKRGAVALSTAVKDAMVAGGILMRKMSELLANGSKISMLKIDGENFISLTDIVRQKNPDFKLAEFGQFRKYTIF